MSEDKRENDVIGGAAEAECDSKDTVVSASVEDAQGPAADGFHFESGQSLEVSLLSGDFVIPELSQNDGGGIDVPTLQASGGIVELEQRNNIYAGKEVYLSIEGGQIVFYRGTYVTRIVLRGESLLFGRRDVMAGHYPDVDLAMYWKQDCSISRRHLRIYADVNGAYYVEDICGHNATFVNSYNRPLNRERLELKPGDRIFVSKSIAVVFCVR